MLKTENLDVYYGESQILRGVNIKAEKGKITALMGRNGVGKTTLLKSLIGLLPARRGHIRLDDQYIESLSTDKRARLGIGYVPQGREIFPKLTVYENLQMGLEARQDGLKKVPEDDVYSLFDVLGKMERRLGGNLSGGQQQQLAIARALVGNPSLLLLDEPTEGIQPSIILEIEKVLEQLKNRGDLGIILVEQYVDFARAIADYVYIMDRGSIIAEGPAEKLDDPEIRKMLTF